MKRIQLLFAGMMVVFAMVSCSKVKEPFIKETTVSGNRVVLLEDYTGVRCVNCPAAAETAHELILTYPDNLVVIGVYAGDQAAAPGIDFRTEAGNTWYSTFGITANPKGTVNRTKNGNGYEYDSDAWGTKIAEEVALSPSVTFNIKPTYNESNRKLDIDINGVFTQEASGDFYLFAGIIEDSIQGKQLFPGNVTNPDYWHCHVFRTPVNGTWGEAFFSGISEPQQEFSKSYSITIDSTYNDNQCYVVSYVYDNTDKSILQAGQAKIK